jgi:hypothetical protein
MEEGNVPSDIVDISKDQSLVEEEGVVFVASKKPVLKTRSVHYLRIAKTSVLPLTLVLHDPSNFTDALFLVIFNL